MLVFIIQLSAIFGFSLLLNKKRPYQVYSILYIFIIYYVFVSIVGYYLYSSIAYSELRISFYNIGINEEELFITLQLILLLVLAFQVGALLHSFLTPSLETSFNSNFVKPRRLSYKKIVLFSLFPGFLIVFGIGISNVFERTVYIVYENQELVIIGKALALFGVLALGYVAGKKKHVFISLVILLSYLLLYIALSSRRVGLVLVVFFLGMLLADNKRISYKLYFFFSILTVPALAQLVLVLRRLDIQGVTSFFSYITEFGITEIVDPSKLLIIPYNISFLTPLSAYVYYKVPTLDIQYFYTSINPMPGFFTDWYQISDVLKVNKFMPFNTIGELLNHGIFIAISWNFMLGIYFSRLDKKVRLLINNATLLNVLLAIFIISIVIVFIVTTTQYNLRSSMRLIYYLVFLEFVTYFYVKFMTKVNIKYSKN